MTFGFVDDIAIRAIGIYTLYRIIQVVKNFFKEMNMKINKSKCKIVLLCKRLVLRK